MSRGGPAFRAVGVLVAFSACLAGEPPHVRAGDPRLIVERLVRHLDWRDGLPTSYLAGVIQDRQGFLWVSGPGGLSRYDGRSFKTVYPHGAALIQGCEVSRRVVFCGSDGRLREFQDGTVVELEAPTLGGEDWSAAVCADGGIWWKLGNRIWRRDPSGRWDPVRSPAPDDRPARRLNCGLGAEVFVSGRDVLWAVSPEGAAREIAPIRGAVAVIEHEDGSVLVGTNQPPGPVTTRVFEVRDGTTRLLFERIGAKLTGLAERGQRVWISTDAGLFGVGDGESPLFIGGEQMSHASGSVFVDREGSLWVATFRGLLQFPEPETFAASFVSVSRNLVHVGTRTWVSSWGELTRFDDGPQGLEARSYGPHFGIVCADAQGRAWTQGVEGLGTLGESRLIPSGGDPVHGPLVACSVGPSGTLWLSVSPPQLLAIRPGDRGPRDLHVDFPEGQDALLAVREDDHGMVWVAGDRVVCRAPAADLLAGRSTWGCEEVAHTGYATDLTFMPSGDVWLATSQGIFRRRDGRWDALAGHALLRSRWMQQIRSSSSGGVWIAMMGGFTRVVERPASPEGLEILEDLSAWQGVPTLNGTEIAEDPDGTLWLATDAGLMKVRGDVRRLQPQPPAIALIEASADGRPLGVERAIDLPYRRNRLELRFAALSYRDPTAIRYRHRVRADEPWSAPTVSPLFRFVDLAPGRYRVEVEASVDGARWSPVPAALAFRVLKPWYLQLPFFAALGTIAAGGLAVMYRVRVRSLLRLERQRTRIAMDLHDEVGSGLGTISVLAGLVAKQELEPERRNEFASRIASVSRELSQALGDIVWSLRPGSGTLDAAWNQIVDRAHPLFASGFPALTVESPETVPPLPLSVVARRSLFLIAIEALHNAARHSGATRVTLGLARDGSTWVLTVADDGRGIAPPPASGRRGLGLDGMRARASDMRASIAWDQGAREGTLVTLRFRPDAD